MDTPTEIEEQASAPSGRTFVKAVTGLVVNVSVKSVVSTIVKQNIVPKSKYQNVQVLVAAWALGSLAAKHATEAADERVDAYAKRIDQIKQKHAEIMASKNEPSEQ